MDAEDVKVVRELTSAFGANDLAKWDAAVEEYKRKHRREEGTGCFIQFGKR